MHSAQQEKQSQEIRPEYYDKAEDENIELEYQTLQKYAQGHHHEQIIPAPNVDIDNENVLALANRKDLERILFSDVISKQLDVLDSDYATNELQLSQMNFLMEEKIFKDKYTIISDYLRALRFHEGNIDPIVTLEQYKRYCKFEQAYVNNID